MRRLLLDWLAKLRLTRRGGEYMATKRKTASLPGVLFVLALHSALFYVLWSQELIPSPKQMAIVFVNIIAVPKPKEEPKPGSPPSTPKPEPVFRLSPKPQPIKQPKPQQLVAEAPVLSQNEPVAPPPPPPREPEGMEGMEGSAAPPGPMSLAPVMLPSELSLACPKLSAPSYPQLSRRLGEEGKLMLRVELDKTGRVSVARVINSSGYKRLDEAALDAVKTWRCNPPLRNGQPVRATAKQPFNFALD